jgi:hypothetical protein
MEMQNNVKEMGKNLIKIVGPILADELRRRWEKYKNKPHGSKVKEGVFKDCTIELAGDKALIAVHPENGEVVWLTSDYIDSFQLVKEKKKLHNMKYKTYFYYHITFKDGSQCYARMRKKYRNAMIKYTQNQKSD